MNTRLLIFLTFLGVLLAKFLLEAYLAYDKDISPISAKQFNPWLHLKTRLKLNQRFFAQRSLLDEPSTHLVREKGNYKGTITL